MRLSQRLHRASRFLANWEAIRSGRDLLAEVARYREAIGAAQDRLLEARMAMDGVEEVPASALPENWKELTGRLERFRLTMAAEEALIAAISAEGRS